MKFLAKVLQMNLLDSLNTNIFTHLTLKCHFCYYQSKGKNGAKIIKTSCKAVASDWIETVFTKKPAEQLPQQSKHDALPTLLCPSKESHQSLDNTVDLRPNECNHQQDHVDQDLLIPVWISMTEDLTETSYMAPT